MSLTDLLRTGGWVAAKPSPDSEHAADARVGSIAGRYRLDAIIAEGGMSTVYRGVRIDAEFEQVVAIKVLHLQALAEDDGPVNQVFQQEKQSLASLNHPHIATIIDAGKFDDGAPYIVMEHVEGLPLDSFLSEQQPERATRLALLDQILDAVAYAHSTFVAHGDLKPSNILVRSDLHVVLVDFGISQLLQDSGIPRVELGFLTPAYASPEQLAGQPPSVGTDIYQLGLIIQLLQGHGRRRSSLILPVAVRTDQIRRRPVLLAALRSGFAGDRTITDDQWLALLAIGQHAANDNPFKRYPSVHGLKEELERLRAKRPLLATAAIAGLRPLWFIRRHRWWLLITSVVLVAGSLHLVQLNTKNQELSKALTKSERLTEFLVELFEANDPLLQQAGTPRDISARELLDRSKAKIEDLNEEPEQQAALLHVLGVVYRHLGLYQDAQPLLEQAVIVRKQLYGDRHLAVADSLHEMGLVLMGAHKAKEARTVIEQEVRIRQALQPASHQELLRAQSTLAEILSNLGEFKSAISVAKDIIKERSSSALRPSDLANDTLLLGNIETRSGETHEGIKTLSLAHGMYAEEFGENSKEVAKATAKLSYAYLASGELALAEKMTRQTIAIYSANYGSDYSAIADLEGRLAQILLRGGKFSEAETLLNKTLSSYATSYGADSNRVAAALPELALAQAALGKCAEAKASMEHAVRISHSSQRYKTYILHHQLFLLNVWRHQGLEEKAIVLNQVLPQGFEQTPALAIVQATIAEAYILTGNYLAGEGFLAEAHKTLNRFPSAEPWHHHYVMSVSGMYKYKTGNVVSGKALLESSYMHLREMHGPFNIFSMSAANRLNEASQSQSVSEEGKDQRNLPSYPECEIFAESPTKNDS